MGLNYHIVQSERKELSGATCDRCQKEITIDGPGHWNPFGKPYSIYHEPGLMESVFVLDQEWGYHSKKDLERHRAVICEACYDVIFKDVKIAISEYLL